MKKVFCENCGNELTAGTKFCDSCGFVIEKDFNSKAETESSLPKPEEPLQKNSQSIVYIEKHKIIFGAAILLVIIIFLGYIFYQKISNEQQKTSQIETQLQNIQKQNLESVQTLNSKLQTQQNATTQAENNEATTEKALEKIDAQSSVAQGNTAISGSGVPNINIQAIVLIMCADSLGNLQEGSGTIIDSRGYVLTNEHVVTDESGNSLSCVAFMNNGTAQAQIIKSIGYNLTISTPNTGYYTNSDAAILQIGSAEYTDSETTAPLPSSFPYIKPDGGNLHQGDTLYIYGYPAASDFNFNLTKGIVSSFDGAFIDTDAIIDHGNSGGAAFSSDGRFIGVPTQKYISDNDYLGQILDISTLNTSLSQNISYVPPVNNSNPSTGGSINNGVGNNSGTVTASLSPQQWCEQHNPGAGLTVKADIYSNGNFSCDCEYITPDAIAQAQCTDAHLH
jgi:S1-C subfamily serine protease